MKKKLLTLFVALVGIALNSAGAIFEVGNFKYSTSGTEAGVADLSSSAKSSGVSILRIPAYVTYNGTDYPVTQIMSSAFEDYTAITEVHIGVNVKTIASYAFSGCKNLATVYNYSPDLATIEVNAFEACSKLTNFYTMATSTGTANANAFTGINSSATLHTVAAYAYSGLPTTFKNATGWSKFKTFKDDWLWMNLTIDGGYAYYRITKGAKNGSTPGEIEFLTVAGTVTTYAPGWGGTWSAEQLKGSSATNASYRITGISSYAFNGNTTVTSVDLTNATYLTRLTSSGILQNSAVKTITFGPNVASIGSYTFLGATALEKFVVPSSNTNFSTSATGGALYNKSVTAIYRYAPAANYSSLNIPYTVTTIWFNAFRDQKYFTYMEIPPTVTTINSGAFANMANLKWIQIPSSVSFVVNNSRDDLSMLFYNDTNLTWIILNQTTPPTVNDVSSTFYGCSKAALVVPVGSTAAYYGNSTYATQFKNKLWTGSYDFIANDVAYTVYNGSSQTVNGTTYDGGRVRVVKCTNLLKKLVTAYHYAGESQLTSVKFEHPTFNSKRYYCDQIGDSVYASNRYVQTVEDATGNITSVGVGAFYGCSALTTVKLKNAVNIYAQAFRNCTKLNSVNFYEMTNLYYIGVSAFYGDVALTDVNLSNCTSLNTIDSYAFYGCSALSSIDWPSKRSLKTISNDAFNGIKGSYAIFVPYGVEKVGSRAFANNASTVRMNIPSSVTTLQTCFALNMKNLAHLGINTQPGVTTLQSSATSEFGTTLKSDLVIDVPNGTVDGWNGKTTGLSTYLHDGGSFDFYNSSYGTNSSVYYTVTKPTTNTNTRGEVSVTEVPSYARKDVATHFKENVSISATWADQGYTYDVTAIGQDAYFVSNSIIRKVQIPASVKTIGANAFRNNTNLNYVGDNAFSANASVPATLKNVTSIGNYAFYNCNLWNTLECNNNLSTIGEGAFLGNPNFRTLLLRRFYNNTSLGTNVWNTTSNEKLKVLVEYRGFEYINSQASTWDGNGASQIVPYVYPNFNYRGAAVPADLNLAQSGINSNIELYYVSYYDRNTNVAQTTRINGNVKAGEGFLVKVKSGVVIDGSNSVGDPYFELPRAAAAVSSNQLSGNLLTGITTSNYSGVNVDANNKFFVVNDEGKYINRANNFSLYADSYLKLLTSIAGSNTTIPLDIANTGKRGDVNNDGFVNATDLGIVVNIIAGLDQAANYDGRADVNGDGYVNATDLGIIVNIIAGLE